MTFALPTAKDPCNLSRSAADAKFLANINSPSNTGTKAAGSLPITGVATEFDGDTNGATKGYAKEFENAQTPAYDVSGDTKLMLWHNQFNAPNRIQVDTVANGGVIIRIYSGTGVLPTDYRDFYVGGNDTPWAECCKGQYPTVIDLNDDSHDASGGTFDPTDVTSFAILTTRLSLAGNSTNWNYQGKMYVVDTIKSSASTPTFTGTSDFQQAVDLIQGTDYTNKLGNWIRQIGSVVFMDMPFRIGDNSTLTNFNDNGATIISPVANDASDPRNRLTLQAMRMHLNLRNNIADTALFSGTYIWGTRAKFNHDLSNDSIVTYATPTYKGMGEFTIGDSVTGPAIFDDVDKIIMSSVDVDLDGSRFTNQFGNHALQLGGGSMANANMTFSNYPANADSGDFDGTTDVDDSLEQITVTAHGFDDGEQVEYSTGGETQITGLVDGDIYWAHVIDANTVSLHTSRDNALTDTSRVGLTDTGSSTLNQLWPKKHAVLIDTAGTYTFDNLTFDHSGSNDVENTSGGLVTINVINGGTVPTVTNTGSGSTTVVNRDVTVTAKVSEANGTAIEDAMVFMRVADAFGSFPSATVTIVNAAAVATVTHTAHGLTTNDYIFIDGGSLTENKGVYQITVTGANTYTYTMTSSPGSSPTGTITAKFAMLYGQTDVAGEISSSKTYGLDTNVEIRVISTGLTVFSSVDLTGIINDDVDTIFNVTMSPR